MTRFIIGVATFVLLPLVLCGCCDSGAALPSLLADPCEAPSINGTQVRLTGVALRGSIGDAFELSTQADTRVGIVADGAIYAATLSGDSITIGRRIAQLGPAEGQLLSVDALTEGQDGSVVAFDRQMHRISRWKPSGAFDRSVTLQLTALADGYVAGGGTVIAVTSQKGDIPYASTTGELRSLDSLGYTDSLLATFPGQVLRLRNDRAGSKFLSRPLERQPIVRWSHLHGWVIASTDSLNIYLGQSGQRRVIAGTGARAPIDPVTRDSSIDEFVRNTGAKGIARAEAKTFATENFFRGRTRLQLIDDIVPLLDGRLAVRRMGLCRDRHGWNMIDSIGRPAGVFTVPLNYRSVMHAKVGVLFAARREESLGLVLVPVAPDNNTARSP